MHRFHHLFGTTETMVVGVGFSTSGAAGEVIAWDDGAPLVLEPGRTARCTHLADGELYGLLLINRTHEDADVEVHVAWHAEAEPRIVTIPGSTSEDAIPSIVFVSGSDTNTLVVAVTSEQLGRVECMLSSVSVPGPGASALAAAPKALGAGLPEDGESYPFAGVRRYVASPVGRASVSIGSPITQFLVVHFNKSHALVQAINSTSQGPLPNQILAVGQSADKAYHVERVTYQVGVTRVEGDGTPRAWLNMDSDQNAKHARIALQLV